MDRYAEAGLTKEIKALVLNKDYDGALKLIEQQEIEVDKLKNMPILCLIGEVYMGKGEYEKAEDILLKVYDKTPKGRRILDLLTTLYVEMKEYAEAEYYYKEFIEVAPRDLHRYILRYRIDKGKGERLSVLIGTLEKLKDYEYIEEWAFELAKLYEADGEERKCLRECDEIVLWFGHGEYVDKAIELKCRLTGAPLPKVTTVQLQKAKEAEENRQAEEARLVELAKEQQLAREEEARRALEDQENLSQLESGAVTVNVEASQEAEQISLAQIQAIKNAARLKDGAGYGVTSEEDMLLAAMNSNMDDMIQVDVDDEEEIDIYNTDSILAGTGVDASLDLDMIEQGIHKKNEEPQDSMSNTDMLLKALNFDSEPAILSEEEAARENPEDTDETEASDAEDAAEAEEAPPEVPEEASVVEEADTETDAVDGDDEVDEIIDADSDAAKSLMAEFGEALEDDDDDDYEEIVTGEEVELSDTVRDIFSSVADVQGIQSQLARTFNKFETSALDNMDILAPYDINFVVSGKDNVVKSQIAIGIAKALNTYGVCDKTKIVRTNSDELNKIDFSSIFEKIRGGCMIIENADGLSDSSCSIILKEANKDGQDVAIVFEGNEERIHQLWKRQPALHAKFLNVINISKYDENELVTLAESYISKKGYELSPEAKDVTIKNVFKKRLASDESVEYEEVMAVVDKAISNLENRNMKNLFMTVLDNKYEEASMFKLLPEDFE